MLARILVFISLCIFWIILVGINFENHNYIFLVITVSSISFFISYYLNILPKKISFKLKSVKYFFWLIKEIIMSSIAVSKIAWRRNLAIQPILEPIKTIQKNDLAKTIYANSITLTPGTVTLSLEKNNLLVHALDISFFNDLVDGDMDKRIKKIIK